MVGSKKKCNLDLSQASLDRKLQLQQLEEMRNEAYESSNIYKAKAKQWHDQSILRKSFHEG